MCFIIATLSFQHLTHFHQRKSEDVLATPLACMQISAQLNNHNALQSKIKHGQSCDTYHFRIMYRYSFQLILTVNRNTCSTAPPFCDLNHLSPLDCTVARKHLDAHFIMCYYIIITICMLIFCTDTGISERHSHALSLLLSRTEKIL